MRGTKRGRLPRYIIIILLRFISTLFHDPIFNTLSQFFSLLDINSTAYSTQITIYILLCFCPRTPILCFCFYLSLTRFLSPEKVPPVLLLKTSFPFSITNKNQISLKKKRNCKCIYLNSVLVFN